MQKCDFTSTGGLLHDTATIDSRFYSTYPRVNIRWGK